MRSFFLTGGLILMLAGCRNEAGSGVNAKVGDLKVGGEARLVSFDGSDVILDPVVAGQGKAVRRPVKADKLEKVKLPVGTTVLVRNIVGDDARVEVKDGARAGSNYWVECNRLDPATN